MAIRKVLSIPNPTLYKVASPVVNFDSKLRTLVRDMFDTMYHENGVGLAAPQINVLQRVLVIDLADSGFMKGVFINPKILETSKDVQRGEEGCLSVPGLAAMLQRPKWVKVSYQNILGEEEVVEGEMLMARALLHEMDHLDGKVFVDQLEKNIRIAIEDDIQTLMKGEKLLNPKIPKYRRNYTDEDSKG